MFIVSHGALRPRCPHCPDCPRCPRYPPAAPVDGKGWRRGRYLSAVRRIEESAPRIIEAGQVGLGRGRGRKAEKASEYFTLCRANLKFADARGVRPHVSFIYDALFALLKIEHNA